MLRIVNRPLAGWGMTYGPPGDGPFPTVMVLHGSEGAWSGYSYLTAAILAAHGFLTFPIGYSQGGNVWNAGNIVDVPLDRTVEALGVLRALPITGRVGLYGVSRGAEHALLVTSLMARDAMSGLPDAVAVHAAPDVICGAFVGAEWRDAGDPGWQAWDPARRAWTWRGTSDGLPPTTAIEIERYRGPLYLSHGLQDAIWSAAMTMRLRDRLHRHGLDPEVHLLADQGHVPEGEGENAHHRRLIAFLHRTLGV
ncbi:BAAT / Acyl-CoA thioester hydrolase C terminal [Methylobacterium phyllostachyos]|uniref:BAAT / Acyl-CoA thioester hydrolase C terminal n=1 Tax=Methylobacterium phyllostachyos TaxID=582672 RepID=A0A1H0AE05_9HYPH|nr:acyl-CoA thioester hydrolase/BAAT C-terminal domain-containing protein [Methylobacterium phyllostachyos]SDN31779.1 BAAT / Acyl-CoA thioester hydrolase C terminal [Methylobacterium phyllostachyos]